VRAALGARTDATHRNANGRIYHGHTDSSCSAAKQNTLGGWVGAKREIIRRQREQQLSDTSVGQRNLGPESLCRFCPVLGCVPPMAA
jgi:hypothetical protein